MYSRNSPREGVGECIKAFIHGEGVDECTNTLTHGEGVGVCTNAITPGRGMVSVVAHLPTGRGLVRSEEHTSERQSHYSFSYAAFCLKKKKYQFFNLLHPT